MEWRTRRPAADAVDPRLFLAALTGAGWSTAGGRTGGYTRLYWPGETAPRGRTIHVSEDRTAPEHESMIASAVTELVDAALVGDAADQVLTALATGQPADPTEPTQLDSAMHSVWLHGRWSELMNHMDTEEREAAVAAVLRYSHWLDPGSPTNRSSVAVWER